MFQIMSEGEGALVGVRATGTLTAADYNEVLLPQLDARSERFDKLRALFFMDGEFKGWDLSAAWANTKLDLRFRGVLEKVAVVGAPAWEEWCVRHLAAPLMKGELRTFRADQLDDAWAWLRG